MYCYLTRHAIAEDLPAGSARDDASRALTARGRTRMHIAARGLLALGVRPQRVLSSPLLRARETAVILAEELDAEQALWLALAPGEGAAQVERGLPVLEGLMLVGHQPDLSALAAHWLGGTPAPQLVFRKGACACLSFDDRPAAAAGRLEWLLQPRQLRALAQGA